MSSNTVAKRAKELGLSQSEIARRLNVTPQWIHQYFHGQVRLNLQQAIELAEVLDLDDPLDLLDTQSALVAQRHIERGEYDAAVRAIVGHMRECLSHFPPDVLEQAVADVTPMLTRLWRKWGPEFQEASKEQRTNRGPRKKKRKAKKAVKKKTAKRVNRKS